MQYISHTEIGVMAVVLIAMVTMHGNSRPHIPVLTKRCWKTRKGVHDAVWEHPVKPFSWLIAEKLNLTTSQVVEWRTAWASYLKRMANIRDGDCPFIVNNFLLDSHNNCVRKDNGSFVLIGEWGVYESWMLDGYNALCTKRRLLSDIESRKMRSMEPAYAHKLEKYADRSVRNNVMFGHTLGDRYGNPLNLDANLVGSYESANAKLENQQAILDAFEKSGWEVRE